MTSPTNPDVKGDSEVVHDGMNDAGHKQQADQA